MFNAKLSILITSISAGAAYLLSYILDVTTNNVEQYLAVIAVMFMDGFFGVIAGIKREGFKTYKAVRILKNVFTWISILTVTLMVEKGFAGTSWLSEVIITPFLIFQIISALKNASMAGFIKAKLLNQILDNIDKHKGERES
jgi:phage-related holin